MSSEVCPKCGKSFKRLKSHLPHCKALKRAITSPQNEETTVSSPSSLSLPGPNHSPHSTERVAVTKSNDQITTQSTIPTLTKKTKQKLSEKIKMALEMSSPASDASSPPSKAWESKMKVPISSQMDEELIENNLENVLFSPKTKSTKPRNSRQNDKEVIEKIENNFEQQAKSTTEYTILNNLKTSKRKNMPKKELKEIFMKKTGSNKAKNITINSVKTSTKDNIWSEEEDNKTNLPENDMWTSRQEPKITLHDVRTTLGRTRQNGRQKNSHFVDQLSTDKLKYEVVNPNYNQSEVPSEVPSQARALSPGKSQIMPLRGSNFLSDLSKIENKDCNFTQRAHILKEGLQMDCHTMGLTALLSPRRTFLEAEVTVKAFKKDVPLLKPNVQKAEREMEEIRMDHRKQDGGQRNTRGVLSQRTLGQVTLRELPDWVVSHSPRRPRDALEMIQRGWQWYYRKYIDVKRGGVGGMAMLLAGYCVLSYVWVYPHLKRDRWRKYH